jgi:hypothetical protein
MSSTAYAPPLLDEVLLVAPLCAALSGLVSLFAEYRVYAFPNTGFLYDLGFFLGTTTFLGGSAASA